MPISRWIQFSYNFKRYRTPEARLKYDAVIIGAGPNGLAAAIEMVRAGHSTLLLESGKSVGGSARSAELTLPEFTHDICSTVAALATSSPFLKTIPLADFGCDLIQPVAPFAHPFDDGSAAVLYRSIEETGRTLGKDAARWQSLMQPFVEGWSDLTPTLLAPPRWPRSLGLTMRFGMKALRSARSLVDSHFEAPTAKALFGGAAAHSIIPLTWRGTSAFGLVLACNAHADGWPIVRGGMQNLVNAMAAYFQSLGGKIEVDQTVTSLDEIEADAILCDVGPKQFMRLAGNRMPGNYRKRYEEFQYGPGVFKIDWALSEPIPWKAADCLKAATVHLGGTFDEFEASEAMPWQGRHADRPFILLVQPSLFDPTRAPAGKHTAWAYCHVPNGSSEDQTAAIEKQVERFAPGFGQTILARHTFNTRAMEAHNPNLIGGDITGGAQTLKQTLARPIASLHPYKTGIPGVFLCSASTPPGGGVHGMCGMNAAIAARRYLGSSRSRSHS